MAATAFGEANICLVGRHHEAGVEKPLRLRLDGADDARRTMASVDATNAAREVDEAVSIYILQQSADGAINVDGRQLRNAPWNRLGSAGSHGPGLWARNRGDESDGRHINTNRP